MKIATSIALALFVASAEAFGPAAPLKGTAFGASTSASRQGDMTMRIGKQDLRRRQKVNDILDVFTKESVEQQLLSPNNDARIKQMNWKLRKATIRKVKSQAEKFGITVDPAFGVA